MAEADLEAVVELMRASLGDDDKRPKTIASFAWKHYENPFGRSIALLAEEGGEIVGLRTLMRWDLETPDGDRLRCLRAVDTATHPRMQRKGIFRRLTEEALEIARDRQLDLVFNTPNDRSGAGYLKMGWSTVGDVRPLVRFSTLTSGEARADVLPPVGDKPPAYRAGRGLRTPRSAEYWTWRFRSHPAVTYGQIVDDNGTAVVRVNERKGRGELLVVDVSGSPWKVIRGVTRSTGASYSATWFSPGTSERVAAMRNLYIPAPSVSMTLVARPLRDLEVDVESMSSWDLSVSDLELL